jgi:hypothetical protein
MNLTELRQLRRLRILTAFFIAALIVSGLTAIPLETELDLLAKWLGGAEGANAAAPGLAHWIQRVQQGIHETNARHPFMAYGYDWLAFGHVVIGISFIGAWRDPVRNRWLYQFGMIACVLVIPWALVFGALRGIPLGWRLIDCAFGVFGFPFMWLAWKWTGQLERRA